MVGFYSDANGTYQPFLFSNGQYVSLPDDPQAGTGPDQGGFATDITPSGQMVGASTDSNNVDHGWLLVDGRFTRLDAPQGANGTDTLGINASGQVAGWYTDANFVRHGFLLSGGQYTTLDDPNAGTGYHQGTLCFGINATAQIVGAYIDANGVRHGFLLSGGQYTTLDDPNGVGWSEADAINDSGQVTGDYADQNGVFHGFVFSGGQYTTVDDPNAAAGGVAFAINNAGQIAGWYIDGKGLYHGYEATPISSPGVPSSPVGQSPAMSTSLLPAAHAIGGAFTPALFGNIHPLASLAPSLNTEARVFVPRSVPDVSSTLVGPGLISITVPQGQTRSTIKLAASADTDVNVLDQLFANFHLP
jgi:hypothetical protein